MNEKLLNSLTINERIDYNLTVYNSAKVKKWFARKSLLNTEDEEFMMFDYYSSDYDFKIGLGDYKKDLNISLDIFPWFDYLFEILDTFTEDNWGEDFGVEYSYRFLINPMYNFISSEIEKNSVFQFDKNFLVKVMEGYLAEVYKVIHRTIISDMHEYKKDNILHGNNGSERFKYYLKIRFNTVENIKNFYLEHPNLVRMLWKRTKYFKKHIKKVIYRLDHEVLKFIKGLGFKDNKIVSIDLSQGDTHDQGQSVAILHFSDGNSLVYKPKNLEIASSIDSLMNFLNQEIHTEFFIPKRLIKSKYAFEQFVKKEEVKQSKDVNRYYYNYGALLGLVYILNGTDFHYENIIAHRHYPVLIDLETFFQQPVPISKTKGKDATRLILNKMMKSVQGTSMLPISLLKERSDDRTQGIDMSGLSTGGQKFPFKVLKLINTNTDEMKYVFGEGYTPKGYNIPTFKSKEFSYHKSTECLYSGFTEFMNNIISLRGEIIKFIYENFNNQKIRHILRPTQRYADLLDYSYHPTCMENAIEREKVLQNLWAYSFMDKRFIKYEMEELLQGDIPQFFVNTSTRGLYTNSNIEFEKTFEKTSLDIVIDKLNGLNEEVISEQLHTIKVSLNDFEPQEFLRVEDKFNKNNQISESNIIKVIDSISETLRNKAVIDYESKTLNYLDTIEVSNLEVTILSDNLYNGLSGIYLYFVVADYFKGSNENRFYRECILNTIDIYSNQSGKMMNPFFGRSSMIYPLLVEYKLFKKTKSLMKAKDIADEILTEKIHSNIDWLNGSIGMIPILVNLYKITNDEKYKKKALEIFNKLDFQKEITTLGFGHGSSSIYYLYKILDIEFDEYVYNLIDFEDSFRSNRRWKSSTIEDVYSSGWCKGDIGICISRLLSFDTLENGFFDSCLKNLTLSDNNTLCHGNSANLELLLQLSKENNENHIINEKSEDIINNILTSHQTNQRLNVHLGYSDENLGLYTGISGVGYQLIRYLDNEIPNVLFFQ